MPEGPEITITAQYLITKLKNKLITDIKILSGRYTHQTLLGYDGLKYPYKIYDICSKGKFLWIELSDNTYIMITFGMTGRFSFIEDNSIRIQFIIKDTKKLNFIDPRNFGTIEFTTNKNKLLQKLNKLAPDALQTTMTDTELVELIILFNNKSKKNKNLVKILMDQSSIVSGIGNYLCAEILYDAKLNPHRDIDSLTKSELKTLVHSIRKLTKYAYYDNTTNYMEYFTTFMKLHPKNVKKGVFPDYHSDIPIKKFIFNVYQQEYDKHGNKVLRDEIIKGRIIHWVKEIQK